MTGCRICSSGWCADKGEDGMENHRKQEEMNRMLRVQNIYRHPLFAECLEKNRLAEVERIFCTHDMEHFLDVARLAYIFSMEREYGIAKEEIYAAALLHDIGKWRQYEEQIPHERAGALLAESILRDTGFDEEECARILAAILNHRRENTECADAAGKLAEVLYDADKISRNCFACRAEKECDWSDAKKNLQILW